MTDRIAQAIGLSACVIYLQGGNMDTKEKKQEVKKEEKKRRQQDFFGSYPSDEVYIKRKTAKTGRIGGIRLG